jgi:hypothetical protein
LWNSNSKINLRSIAMEKYLKTIICWIYASKTAKNLNVLKVKYFIFFKVKITKVASTDEFTNGQCHYIFTLTPP